MHYRDFELEFEHRGDHRYAVRAREGSSRARGEVELAADWPRLDALATAITSGAPHSAPRSFAPEGPGAGAGPALDEQAEALGRALFHTVVPDPIREAFQAANRSAQDVGEGLRIRLNLQHAPALARLQWELLHDGGDFLATGDRYALVRHVDRLEPWRPLTVSGELRVLVVVAGPTDLGTLDAAGECRRLRAAVAELDQVSLEIIGDGRWDSLCDRLAPGAAPCHVLHFIGHGLPGSLVFCDAAGGSAPQDVASVATLLKNHPSLSLVVANACQTSAAQGDLPGLAAELVRRAVPAVVGMQAVVSDAAAKDFAQHFYRALASGVDVERALVNARMREFTRPRAPGCPRGVEWVTPTLYLRAPDGQLIATAEPQPEAAEPAPQRPTRSRGDPTAWGLLTGPAQKLRSRELHVQVRREGGWALAWGTAGVAFPDLTHTHAALPDGSPEALFDWLFPRAVRDAVFQRVCASPSPRTYPLRLRLVCSEAEFHALDWERLAHRGQALVQTLPQWTVERALSPAPTHDVQLANIRKRTLAAFAPPGHRLHAELADALRVHTYAFDDGGRGERLALVDEPAHLLAELSAPRTAVYAVDWPAEQLQMLRNDLRDRAVQILCTVGCRAVQPADLLAHVPVVVQPPTDKAGRHWLLNCLVKGWDPVTAAPPGTRVWTHFRKWHAEPLDVAYRPPPELVLDRGGPRSRAYEVLRQGILKPTGRKVQPLLAMGPPSNHAEAFGSQLIRHLEELQVRGAEFVYQQISVPDGFSSDDVAILTAELEAEVTKALPEARDLRAQIRAAVDDVPLTDKAVLVLDFGAWGMKRRVTSDHFDAWLEVVETLKSHLPSQRNVRLVPLVTVQTADPDALTDHFADPEYLGRLYTLPPLSDVILNDLLLYFEDGDNCSESHLAAKLARALFKQTAGQYEQTVQLLQRGHAIGWAALLAEIAPKEAPRKKRKVF